MLLESRKAQSSDAPEMQQYCVKVKSVMRPQNHGN